LTTKYFGFQYSVTYCSQALRRPAHRACERVHLLTHETPEFITPALWPANSADLNPADHQIWGSCRSVRTAARFVTSLPDRVKPSFVIFDTRALWRPRLSVRVPGCQEWQMTI